MEISESLLNTFRSDGRKCFEIRPPEIQVDVVNGCNGSCLYNIGETKVLVWISGPKENKNKNPENRGTVRCNFTISSFANSNRKADYKRNLQMREFSSTLKEIFEDVINLRNYNKSEIEINAILLQNDGSYKSATISAITLALINGGILLKDTAVGVSIGIINGSYFSDPHREEEKLKQPILNSAYLPSQNKFVFIEMSNSTLDYQYAESLLKFAEKTGEVTFNYVKDYLKNSYLI